MSELERLEKACEESLSDLYDLAYVTTTKPYRDQYGYPTGETYESVVAVHADYEKIYDAYRNMFDLIKTLKKY